MISLERISGTKRYPVDEDCWKTKIITTIFHIREIFLVAIIFDTIIHTVGSEDKRFSNC